MACARQCTVLVNSTADPQPCLIPKWHDDHRQIDERGTNTIFLTMLSNAVVKYVEVLSAAVGIEYIFRRLCVTAAQES